MKTLITLLFVGMFLVAHAQEQATTLRLSLDEATCNDETDIQINLQACEPADRDEEVTGLRESERDWDNFAKVDNSFECNQDLSQQGCEAVFRLEGHGLDRVLNVSIVKFEDGAMELMQVLIPVQKAGNQTEIEISDIPFKVTAINLKNKLEEKHANVARQKKVHLVPAEGAF